MMKSIIDELLNKARSYPKVEGYLRDLDKKRIDEGKDVPVTKRETAVRQADENAAKRLESQGKSVTAEDLSSGRKTDKTSKAPAGGNRPYYESKGKQKPLEGRKTGKPVKNEEMYSYGGQEDYDRSHATSRFADEDISNHRKFANPAKSVDILLEKAEGRSKRERDMERLAEAEYRFRQNNPEDVTKPDSLDINFDKENIMAAKSFDDQTAEYFVKCHSHVLFGEEEKEFEAKKKEAPKGKGHVFGNDPKDKRGSELEMVKKKEPQAYKSEESDLVKSIDALMEKAVIGYHARGGKFETGTHKNPKAHGKVSSPSLSEERKKEIIEGGRKKALTQAEMGGLHAQAAKIRAEKSIDDRTIDYVEKSMYDVVNHKRFSRQDPDAGWDRVKEQRMDRDASALKESIDAAEKKLGEGDSGPMKKKSQYSDLEKSLVRGGKVEMSEEKRKLNEDITRKEMNTGKKTKLSEGGPGGKAVALGMKSLDERTCDLYKALTKERGKEIHDAVTTARMIREDMPEASNMKVKPEDLTRVVRTHNNMAAARTQKSICDKWQDSPFITKGSRVLPIGPGGDVQDLSKDEEPKKEAPLIGSRPGARGSRVSTEPSYNEVESKMNEIQEAKVNKRAAKMRDTYGAE